jgi:hypothetical protein
LLALTWSSVGILPSIALQVASSRIVVPHRHDGGPSGRLATHEHHAHGSGHVHHAKGDFSDIPGSPTHPLDHECVQCQVLTHLARCVFDAGRASCLEVVRGRPVRPNVAVVARAARDVADIPPARGPPLHSA